MSLKNIEVSIIMQVEVSAKFWSEVTIFADKVWFL